MRLYVSGSAVQYARLSMWRVALALAAVGALLFGNPAYADHRSFGRDGHNPSCWVSSQALAAHAANYEITGPIPDNWFASIEAAAKTWTDVAPSPFRFGRVASSSNEIRLAALGANGPIATTYGPNVDVNTQFAPITTTFNSNKSHGATSAYDHNVHNTMSHEFGHWLILEDVIDPGCSTQTMYAASPPGDIGKRFVEAHDKEGVNWQYS